MQNFKLYVESADLRISIIETINSIHNGDSTQFILADHLDELGYPLGRFLQAVYGKSPEVVQISKELRWKTPLFEKVAKSYDGSYKFGFPAEVSYDFKEGVYHYWISFFEEEFPAEKQYPISQSNLISGKTEILRRKKVFKKLFNPQKRQSGVYEPPQDAQAIDKYIQVQPPSTELLYALATKMALDKYTN